MVLSFLRWLSGSGLRIIGLLALTFAALFSVVRNSFYDRSLFADRTAEALHDPGVREFLSDRVTDGVVGLRPDLIAVRPFVLAAANGLIGTRPFESLVRTAATQTHDLIFSEGAERVVLVIPDVGLLVRNVLARANPELSAKLPAQLTESLATLGEGRGSEMALRALRLGTRLRRSATALLVVGLVLLGLAIWVTPDRHQAARRIGLGFMVAGGLLIAAVPVTRAVLGTLVDDRLLAGAAGGMVAAYLGACRTWGIAYLGLGLIMAAGGAAFLDRFTPSEALKRLVPRLLTPPEKVGLRLLWAFGVIGAGLAIALNPTVIAAAVVVSAGALLAYGGIRELFRLLALWAGSVPAVEQAASRRGWSAPVVVIGVVATAALVAWAVVRNPLEAPVSVSTIVACNGEAALCDRRLNDVVFPGAHNAMSNQDIPDWMFPHHQAGIRTMLQDGIRAFAIDIHYGFPGGARVKTDLAGKSAEKLAGAVGAEAAAIAERIRNTLVGADEGKRGLFFCHGFCELGGYDVVPVLREVREFLVTQPDEVVVLIIEDYVSPGDLMAAFDEAGLSGMVFTATGLSDWPTLRTLITMNQRVVVFIESGTAGVPWLRPTEGNIQETPYTFHAPEEFSCRPNRGGTEGALFLLNHWIETTPSPKPSNAAIVNARDVLLARARQCQQERQRLPNILLVDFYRSGDVVGVAREMNGAGSREVGRSEGR